MSYKFSRVMVCLTFVIKTLANVSNVNRTGVSVVSARSFQMEENKMCSAGEKLLQKKLAPPLSEDRHKGQAGRIGIFGGSIEYTGEFHEVDFRQVSPVKVCTQAKKSRKFRIGRKLLEVVCFGSKTKQIPPYHLGVTILLTRDHIGALIFYSKWPT